MKKKWILPLLLVLTLCIFTGCGKGMDDIYEKGITALESGEYMEAANYFEELLSSGQRKAESYRGLGIAAYEMGDYSQALTSLTRCLEVMEGENDAFAADVLYYKGAAARAYGDLSQALDAYTELLEYSYTADAFYRRGVVYMEKGDENNAQADFQKALSLDDRYDLYQDIYTVCMNYGEKKMAEALVQEALEKDLNSLEDYYYQGLFSYNLGYYDQAQSLLVEAVNDGDDASRLLLGKVYLAMEDTASARALFNEYLQQHENSPSAYNGLALCDIAEENYDAAMDNLEKGLACESEEDIQSLEFNRIVVYEYMHDFETAESLMAEYVKKYPNDETAAREYVFLQAE